MSTSLSAQRLRCARCLRPHSACICQWITPTAHSVEVVVLQHPLEVNQAKGSARLLHLSLPHSVLVIGETFPEATLQALISAPLRRLHPQDTGTGTDTGADADATPRHTLLLYPDSPPGQSLGLLAPPALPPALLEDASRLRLEETGRLRLIVLDGTWRKSRKMLYLNPLLQQLPRLALRDTPASRYRIRKAHLSDQLSTLEATCAALAQLEKKAGVFEPLLAAFDGFVAQQSGYRA